MKITFLCGCLEQGQDGVGDYTRRLAGELNKNGHEVSIISLNDHYLPEDGYVEQVQDLIPVVRVRQGNRAETLLQVKRKIEKLGPEWLSLQYVPFAFHIKGLPWNLNGQLYQLGKGRKWHIMFHELWIGMEQNAPLKFRLWGSLQKIIIKKTIRLLSPQVIHTQTRVYQAQIERLGYKAEFLPLFGNIPVQYNAQMPEEKEINIAVFGGIQKGSKIETIANSLPVSYRYNFHFVGNNGSEKIRWMRILEKANIKCTSYDWMNEREVSKVLSRCQWGFISTPYYLAEKSGAAIAMLEHNLRVYCIAREWIPRKIRTDNLFNSSIIDWNEGVDLERIQIERKRVFTPGIKAVSKNFCNSLLTTK